MKYGIIVSGKVTEPVTVPPSKEGNPSAWLAVQFPGYSGWVLVSDDAVPGATYNGPGSSTNPPLPGSAPKDKTAEEFEAWAIKRLGSIQAWQALLEKCAAHAGTENNDREVRYFSRWAALSAPKSKAETQARLTPLTLVSPTPIITGAAMDAALALWG